jgi:mono/diheme cytochrome c family protein
MPHRKRTFLLSAMAATCMLSSFLLKDKDLQESIKRGEQVYSVNCSSCHMENGAGLTGTFPPLAQSDYLMADSKRAIRQIKNGVDDEMMVNGITYYGFMPAQPLSNEQVADVMNYIRNSWGNKGEMLSVEDVIAALKQ